MKDLTVLQYIMTTVENEYVDRIEFEDVNENDIRINVIVSNEFKKQPVIQMIEANLYTKSNLLAKYITHDIDRLTIGTFNNITYYINLISSK